jgi:large subunit ribosomal protein L25
MKEVTLEAQSREIKTKHTLKDMRLKGFIPAVFYGQGEKSLSLGIDAKKFDEILHVGGSNVLVNLKIGSDSKTAIVKEIQRDVISRKPIHIDFQMISMTDKIEVSVPVHILGIAPGVKLSGGVMEHLIREVKVSCLPADIPQSIDIDVSKLEINRSITVKDLPPMKGIDIINLPNTVLVSIVAPTILEEVAAPGTEAAVGATGSEPEVIAKGKKDEEGAVPAAGDKKADASKAAPKAPEKK